MTNPLKNLLIIIRIILIVLLLPLPKGYAAGIITIDSVFTCDLSDNPKTVFNAGDNIRYKINFTTDNLTFLVLLFGQVKGATFQETLPLQYGILSTGTHMSSWDSKIPSDASGQQVTVCIQYIGIIGNIAAAETIFTIERKPTDEPDYVGSNVCGACHSETFEFLKDSSHGFIECETCHGPGSVHIATLSPDDIFIDRSSVLCGQCHTRGDSQNRVEAEDGLIKRNQQYDELLSGAKSFLPCVQCHDPHVSLTSDTQDAITSDCSSCHSQTINQVHSRAGIECIDCHMPYAVKKATSSGQGDHLKGDTPTHIFAVNSTAKSDEMFYQQSGKTFADGFITLNFLCLGCHNGIDAREHDIDWAIQAAGLIHSE